jgi:hypothetical protein
MFQIQILKLLRKRTIISGKCNGESKTTILYFLEENEIFILKLKSDRNPKN